MDQLPKALQSWKGPQSVITTLREAGYEAHNVYAIAYGNFVRRDAFRLTSKHIGNRPQGIYLLRRIRFRLGEKEKMRGYYRSPYLDQLSSEAKKFVTQFRVVPSVHPCIHAYYSEMEFGGKPLYPRIRARVEDRKYDEWTARNITGSGWTDT